MTSLVNQVKAIDRLDYLDRGDDRLNRLHRRLCDLLLCVASVYDAWKEGDKSG